MNEKRCPRCDRTLPRTEFGRSSGQKDGLQTYCRPCQRSYGKQWGARRRAERRLLKYGEVPPGSKWCPGCRQAKPEAEWDGNRAQADRRSSYCKPCRSERGRREYYKRTYGLTPEEVQQMLDSQAGVCVICLSAKAEHVDHDHETGRVRGILCFSCNAALGQFRDRPDALRRAADYLEGNVWKPTLVAPGVYRLPS